MKKNTINYYISFICIVQCFYPTIFSKFTLLFAYIYNVFIQSIFKPKKNKGTVK